MKLTEVHSNKRLVSLFAIRYSLLMCIILLLSSLPFTNAIAAPPLDDPEPEEIRLDAQDESGQVELKEGQTLVISLESNPSTGHIWEVEETDKTILRQRGKTEFESESHLLGAPVQQILRFEAVAAGRATLKLIYHRPWEKDVEPAKIFSLQVQGVGPFTQIKSPTPAFRLRGSTEADPKPTHDKAPTAEPSILRSPSPIPHPSPSILHSSLGLPSAYSWCDQGGCTSVKDQGSCGSCWAFGTVGPLESNIKIHDGLEKDLSEQYLVSCNTDGWGCSGGWWAHDYHLNKTPSGESEAGAVYEADFPYVARDDSCNPPHTHHEKLDSWAYVGSSQSVPAVAAIKQAIYDHGPVSAAICVGSSFESYSSGIFQTNESCSGDVNHAVVLVGWDDSQGIWHLRNSWGPGWGENGYMRIKYGTSNVGYSANYIVYSGSGCQDAYESNDTSPSARTITINGTTQHHTFHESGDVDWIKFTVTAGNAYTITTSNLEANNDTVLELYDTDGTTKLKDDDCVGLASCINNWIAPGDGTYFIKVGHSTGQGDCAGYGYDLAVVSDGGEKSTEVFLPLIMRTSSSNGGLVNGDFESGPTGWVEYSSNGWDLILPASNFPVTPHSGNWAVWLGGDYDEISYIQQQVPVPAGSPYLAYWHWIASEDLCGYDFGGVIIDSTVVDVYNLCSSENTGGWVKHVVNLSAYARKSVSLQIRTETDSSGNSNLFIDDVSFQASASPVKNNPAFFDAKSTMAKSDQIIPRDGDKEKEAEAEFLLRPQSRTTNEKVLEKHKLE
jgi:C1A family cysteine protease/predicted secreted protein